MTIEEKEMLVRDAMRRLRTDCKMSKTEWLRFCTRYANRNVSTVIWYLKELYNVSASSTMLHSIMKQELAAAKEEAVLAHA